MKEEFASKQKKEELNLGTRVQGFTINYLKWKLFLNQ